jgi:hypothetical protein
MADTPPAPTSIVDQAISQYQSMLRRNGGDPSGLALNAEINLSTTQQHMRTVGPSAPSALERDKLVVEIAKAREKHSFPDRFSATDKTRLEASVTRMREAASIATEVSRDLGSILKNVAQQMPDPANARKAAALLRADDARILAADNARTVAQAEDFIRNLGKPVTPAASAADDAAFKDLLKQPFKPAGRAATGDGVPVPAALREQAGIATPVAHVPNAKTPNVKGVKGGGGLA